MSESPSSIPQRIHGKKSTSDMDAKKQALMLSQIREEEDEDNNNHLEDSSSSYRDLEEASSITGTTTSTIATSSSSSKRFRYKRFLIPAIAAVVLVSMGVITTTVLNKNEKEDSSNNSSNNSAKMKVINNAPSSAATVTESAPSSTIVTETTTTSMPTGEVDSHDIMDVGDFGIEISETETEISEIETETEFSETETEFSETETGHNWEGTAPVEPVEKEETVEAMDIEYVAFSSKQEESMPIEYEESTASMESEDEIEKEERIVEVAPPPTTTTTGTPAATTTSSITNEETTEESSLKPKFVQGGRTVFYLGDANPNATVTTTEEEVPQAQFDQNFESTESNVDGEEDSTSDNYLDDDVAFLLRTEQAMMRPASSIRPSPDHHDEMLGNNDNDAPFHIEIDHSILPDANTFIISSRSSVSSTVSSDSSEDSATTTTNWAAYGEDEIMGEENDPSGLDNMDMMKDAPKEDEVEEEIVPLPLEEEEISFTLKNNTDSEQEEEFIAEVEKEIVIP